MGFDPAKADVAVGKLMDALAVLPEPPDMAVRWRTLASGAGVSGRQVHDTRIVALMHTHGVTEIVTHNGADFGRFTGIRAIAPKDVGELISGRP